MAWYENAVFYHIYPLGLTGAPMQNSYGAPEHRLPSILPWVDHLRSLGCTALYIGPLFESVGHGYETTDYRKVDSRLGTNEDLQELVAYCHARGIRVILDAVFNHSGRDFFAFQDLLKNREASAYRDWYRGVDFHGDNGYHDGLRYETWGGYDLLVKFALENPRVRQYHLETVEFWVREFDIDGLRLDAADVLDFGFMRELRQLADRIKPEFWLMGEVIHGEYARWVNAQTLHSVTNYRLHKALYSSHNAANYFELAHTVEHLFPLGYELYCFADNHDVERIGSCLREPAHFYPLHALLFTLPGLPSVYYGSEFAVPGRKERGSDAGLRPALKLSDFPADEPHAAWIRTLAQIRAREPALQNGVYRRLALTTTAFAFSRRLADREAIAAVNNSAAPAVLWVDAGQNAYASALSGETLYPENGKLRLSLDGFGTVILVPTDSAVHVEPSAIPRFTPPAPAAPAPSLSGSPSSAASFSASESPSAESSQTVSPSTASQAALPPVPDKPITELTVPELQALILSKLAKNGPVTDRMRREVLENVYPDSLRNWARSFR